MCGIAGILGRSAPAARERVTRMIGLLNHRGPDGNAVTEFPGAVLGHTRLKIIDLSDRAQQPMTSPDGRFALVYNGEIYNYLELRQQLKPFHQFTSTSDTEVLLAAWLKWGSSALDRFNGMFSFCLYDARDGVAFMARDRFGQKPFYYAEQEGHLLFASEVKPLLAAGVRAEPDFVTWNRYLCAASYDDDCDTFFRGIQQLQPGECAVWREGQAINRRFYYRLADKVAEENNPSEEEAADMVRNLIVDAVNLHMRSDVPVGISLSGGLDSSTLLAGIELSNNLHSGVACFSVDFGDDLTEAPWINASARAHGLQSHIETFERRQFLQTLTPMIWQLEGPIGGLMNSAFLSVMAAARRNNVTVLQDGSGLDEAFGGYRNHHNLYLASLIASQDSTADDEVGAYARAWGCTTAEAIDAAKREISNAGTSIDGTIPVRPDLLADAFRDQHGMNMPTKGSQSHPCTLKRELIDYLEVRKIPRNARMKDRISMAFGIELRMPFLDHRLIEFAMRLPSSMYFLDGLTKGIVRRAFAGAVDDSVVQARKRSIQAPQGQWLRTEPMRSFIGDLIHSRRFAERGIFDIAKCKTAFESFCAGEFSNSFFVWQWINVELWFRSFIDGDPIRRTAYLSETQSI